jgi:hypothetical protein
LARETLALTERELRERLQSVEQDCHAYRAVAQQAVHVLREVVVARDRLRRRVREQQHHIRALLEIGDSRGRRRAA